MCVGFWSLDHPRWSLVFCANRDEFLNRPTRPAAWHDFGGDAEPSSVLSGVDELRGGTWLGVNRSGRIAFVTNVSENEPNRSISRGRFLKEFLSGTSSSDFEGFIERSTTKSGETPLDIGGFNLLLLQPSMRSRPTRYAEPSSNVDSVVIGAGLGFDAALLTNHGGGGEVSARPLDASCDEFVCGGMSNAIDGSDVDGLRSSKPWTKVSSGRRAFEALLGEYKGVEGVEPKEDSHFVDALMHLLSSRIPEEAFGRERYRETILIPPQRVSLNAFIKRTASQAGRDNERPTLEPHAQEKALYYGTQLSTVILVDRRTRGVLFVERDRVAISEGGDPNQPLQTAPRSLGESEAKETQRVFRFDLPNKGVPAPDSDKAPRDHEA